MIDQLSKELDLNSDVFLGLPVLQKYTKRSIYETKFCWIKLKTKTIHLSEYMTKNRRHKEAPLDDLVNVIKGPPKKPTNRSKQEDELCLTLIFRNGGGIDLKFNNKQERDRWSEYIHKISPPLPKPVDK
jgi:hypothetical protein